MECPLAKLTGTPARDRDSVHLDGLKCRAQIPSMGHNTWPHVTSFPFLHFHSVITKLRASQTICHLAQHQGPSGGFTGWCV